MRTSSAGQVVADRERRLEQQVRPRGLGEHLRRRARPARAASCGRCRCGGTGRAGGRRCARPPRTTRRRRRSRGSRSRRAPGRRRRNAGRLAAAGARTVTGSPSVVWTANGTLGSSTGRSPSRGDVRVPHGVAEPSGRRRRSRRATSSLGHRVASARPAAAPTRASPACCRRRSRRRASPRIRLSIGSWRSSARAPPSAHRARAAHAVKHDPAAPARPGRWQPHCSASAGSAPSSHAASKPAANASPAPVVSTDLGRRGGRRATSRVAVAPQRAARPRA